MRIPKRFLRERVTIRPYTGSGFDGPSYGDPFPARCHIETRRRVITDRAGREVTSEAVAFFLPETDIATQYKLTWAGREYEVIEARPMRGLGQPSHIEVHLK